MRKPEGFVGGQSLVHEWNKPCIFRKKQGIEDRRCATFRSPFARFRMRALCEGETVDKERSQLQPSEEERERHAFGVGSFPSRWSDTGFSSGGEEGFIVPTGYPNDFIGRSRIHLHPRSRHFPLRSRPYTAWIHE